MVRDVTLPEHQRMEESPRPLIEGDRQKERLTTTNYVVRYSHEDTNVHHNRFDSLSWSCDNDRKILWTIKCR